MENKKVLPLSIIILAISVVFGSIYITSTLTTDNKTLTLSQVAEYLNMTKEDVRGIIQTEQKKLDETHYFEGKMFPYFIIDNKYYFYKDEIDEWLKEVSNHRRQYNTTKGWVFE